MTKNLWDLTAVKTSVTIFTRSKKEHRYRWVLVLDCPKTNSPRVEMLFRLTYLEDRKYLLQLDKSQID